MIKCISIQYLNNVLIIVTKFISSFSYYHKTILGKIFRYLDHGILMSQWNSYSFWYFEHNWKCGCHLQSTIGKILFSILHILYPFSVSVCIWSLNAIFYNCIFKHFLLFLCLLWKHYEKERTTKAWCRFWLCNIWTNFSSILHKHTKQHTLNIHKNAK